MKEDIQENELQWIDYEVQDTQARFDLADMILHQLTGEIVSFLQQQMWLLTWKSWFNIIWSNVLTINLWFSF